MNRAKKLMMITLFTFIGINSPINAGVNVGKVFRVLGYSFSTLCGIVTASDGAYNKRVFEIAEEKLDGNFRKEIREKASQGDTMCMLYRATCGWATQFISGSLLALFSIEKLFHELKSASNKTENTDEKTNIRILR